MPQQGYRPTTQACALTGNRTSNLSLGGTTFNQLSHAGQGIIVIILEQAQFPMTLVKILKGMLFE